MRGWIRVVIVQMGWRVMWGVRGRRHRGAWHLVRWGREKPQSFQAFNLDWEKSLINQVWGESLKAQPASGEGVGSGFGHKKVETAVEAKNEGKLGSHLPLTVETVGMRKILKAMSLKREENLEKYLLLGAYKSEEQRRREETQYDPG